MNIKEHIEEILRSALRLCGFRTEGLVLEHPFSFSLGDYATTIALVLGKKEHIDPLEVAAQIVEKISTDELVAKVEVAPPGFINFFLSKRFFEKSLEEIILRKDKFGYSEELKNKKIIVEYTDPNPFKEFHVGHLMSNTIGEAVSRLIEWSGAEIKRACYQGDVGAHVAKTIWAMLKMKMPKDAMTLSEKASFLGKAYARGAKEYEKNKEEMDLLNKTIYEKSDPKINELYEKGKKWSLEYFETIYKKLGTKFDFYFFESVGGELGKKIVEENTPNVFEKSDGAVVFRGEQYGLHTRVFINSLGLPTYESKELGLASLKYKTYPYDESIVITGNEIVDYFKVLLKALERTNPELASKTRHIAHGMLRLSSGKLSSRMGDVITAEALLTALKEEVMKKMDPTRFPNEKEKEEIAEKIAVSALKFQILKQSPGRDIIFDFKQALSLEGDSGPYLEYTLTRALSVLNKAREEEIEGKVAPYHEITELERLVYFFPEVVKKARELFAPQYIVQYLITLAQTFNNFYDKVTIVENTKESPYKVLLTQAVAIVLKNGLDILGIQAVAKM